MSNLASLILQNSQNQPNFADSYSRGQANAINAAGANQKLAMNNQAMQRQSALQGLLGQGATAPELMKAGYLPEAKIAADINKVDKDTLGVKDISSLSKEITPVIKGTQEIYSSAANLDALRGRNSPAAQLAAVFSFMKAMDPSSTVRESEQGQVYEAQGPAKALAAKVNQYLGEGGLLPDNFDDLVGTAKTLANSQIESSKAQLDSLLGGYEGYIPQTVLSRQQARLPTMFDIGGSQPQPQPQPQKQPQVLKFDSQGNLIQ